MNRKEGIAVVISLATFGVCGALISRFFSFHEHRLIESGMLFDDPVLGLLPSADVSIPIFSITYGAILLFALTEWKSKNHIMLFGFSAALLQLFRMVSLSLLPLLPPNDLVPLNDPFLNELIYPGDITGDLFFSGHTAMIFVLFFISKKWYYLALVVPLMVLLMVQRVHYSIDVLAAFPFAWFTVFVVVRLKQWIENKLNSARE